MKPVRLGFIGLGHIPTRAHLPALVPLVEAGEVTLQAFCDINDETAKTQAATFGAQAVYTDHHEMLDKEELDAIYLCIPPTLHTDEILIAADKELAIFVEKPQTLDMAQAVRFETAIQEGGRCLPSWLHESLLSVGGRGVSEIARAHLATRLGATSLQRQPDPLLDQSL